MAFSEVNVQESRTADGTKVFKVQVEFLTRESFAFDFSPLGGVDAKLLRFDIIPCQKRGYSAAVLLFDRDPKLTHFDKERVSVDRFTRAD